MNMNEFQLVSDIHLDANSMYIHDFSDIVTPTARILVICGDTCTHKFRTSETATNFFHYLYERWDVIIEVLGNHDMWGLDYKDNSHMFGAYTHNVNDKHIIVNNVALVYGDITFHCSTLWSKIDKKHEQYISRAMNDYHHIKKFTTHESTHEHNSNVNWLGDSLHTSTTKYNVVVTHHNPSFSMVNDKYIGSSINSAFTTNLDYMIKSCDMDVWVCGHSHDTYDHLINNVRCVRNPVGYLKYEKTRFNNKLIIKL